MATTEPIRDKKQIQAMAAYYFNKGKLRNYLLIILGVHTGLRIGDLLQLRQSDVYDCANSSFRSHLQLVEQKTGKVKGIALNRKVVSALKMYFSNGQGQAGDFLFQSQRKKQNPIGRTQAWRIIREAVNAVGLMGCYGCHSMRKSLGYHAWKSGVQAVLLMDIFNHSSFEVTKRYLGISQDERDQVYLGLNLV